MNTDPNVHVSVSKETIHFADFVERWLSSTEARAELLAGLRRTEMLPIPRSSSLMREGAGGCSQQYAFIRPTKDRIAAIFFGGTAAKSA